MVKTGDTRMQLLKFRLGLGLLKPPRGVVRDVKVGGRIQANKSKGHGEMPCERTNPIHCDEEYSAWASTFKISKSASVTGTSCSRARAGAIRSFRSRDIIHYLRIASSLGERCPSSHIRGQSLQACSNHFLGRRSDLAS